jgi:hypothetical protein
MNRGVVGEEFTMFLFGVDRDVTSLSGSHQSLVAASSSKEQFIHARTSNSVVRYKRRAFIAFKETKLSTASKRSSGDRFLLGTRCMRATDSSIEAAG